jgi:hypothetical protein
MKVFVSSTCCDLIDLRAELHDDLRDLGVEARFSDIKESDFELPNNAVTNSIETCLINLRACNVVVVVLSQRYGPPLPELFDRLSAAHLEYREARKHELPCHVYIRDRLVADWTAWKRNGRTDDYRPTWAAPADMAALFGFIEEHQQLVRESGEADSNNWYWPFRSSVDLRADLRRRLAPAAFRATGEKLVRAGEVPIILVWGQGVAQFRGPPAEIAYRFAFDLVNAGTSPAIGVYASLEFGSGSDDPRPFSGDDAILSTILPGGDSTTRLARQVHIDISRQELDAVSRKFGSEDVL